MDVFAIAKLIREMMNEQELTIDQARSRAIGIVEAAADVVEEDLQDN